MEVAEFLMRVSTPPQHKQKKKNIPAWKSDCILPPHVMITVQQATPKLPSVLQGRRATGPSLYFPPISNKFLKWKSKIGCILRKSMFADLAPCD